MPDTSRGLFAFTVWRRAERDLPNWFRWYGDSGMAFTVGDWMTFLQGADTLIGLPLLVAGAALMVAGWRLWKVCVVLSFGLIGAGLGQRLAGSADGSSYYALVAGVVLGVLSYFPARQSVAVLGGLIGTALAMYVLADAGLNGAPLWLVGAAVFLCCTAMAYTNRKTVVGGGDGSIGSGIADVRDIRPHHDVPVDVRAAQLHCGC